MLDGKEVDFNRVFLMVSGDGGEGSEWELHSIHLTMESAEQAKREHEVMRTRPDGSTYYHPATIEEWPVDV